MKAVVLAGGSGTRLWPLSRRQKPKQFQKLGSSQTLFQEAVARLKFLKPQDIYVATNAAFEAEVRAETPEIPIQNILIEPALRDTGPCIGLAAAIIAKNHPDEVMAVLYADHLIQNKKEFQKKLRVAERLSQEEKTLNIIEVKAKNPNVNLGYVKIGKMIKAVDEVEIYSFERFIEKPNLKTAEKFLQSYKYLWNTGIYVWKVDTILKAYKRYLPETYRRLMTLQAAWGTPNQKSVIEKEYPQCEKISIDYAIMEKVDPEQVRIIPADLGWSDIGTWLSFHEELAKSAEENITQGETLSLETEGSVILNNESKKLVVTVGIKDLAIINTPDALLVCNKRESQKVKKVIEMLEKRGRKDLL